MQKIWCYCAVFAWFYFEFEGNFRVQAPGGLYLEGQFIGGFFTLRVWGACIWRGLFSEFYGNITLQQTYFAIPLAKWRKKAPDSE